MKIGVFVREQQEQGCLTALPAAECDHRMGRAGSLLTEPGPFVPEQGKGAGSNG